jgi:hypothetical protein
MLLYTKVAAFCIAFGYSAFTIKKHILSPLSNHLEDELSDYQDTERKVD